MLGDLPDQRPAVRVGHPVAWLDLLLGVDDLGEVRRQVLVRGGAATPSARCRRAKLGLGGLDLTQQAATGGVVRGPFGAEKSLPYMTLSVTACATLHQGV